MTLEQWLNKYAESHQNPTNQIIHKICVPLIMWCVMALTYSVPALQLGSVSIGLFHILIFGSLFFYFRLGQNVGMVMLATCSFFFLLILLIEQTHYLWQIALFLFVVSWIFQFYGHKVEGKKPSFLDDLKFLFVGPLWVMRYIKAL
jgi:uncharacterized membrane protein YGL010W